MTHGTFDTRRFVDIGLSAHDIFRTRSIDTERLRLQIRISKKSFEEMLKHMYV